MNYPDEGKPGIRRIKNYVVAYKFEKGLLINFGATS